MSFTKNMGENIGENISKNLCSKYGRNFFIMLKKPQQNISETVTNEHDKEIPEERHVSPEERQKIIDELRLK